MKKKSIVITAVISVICCAFAAFAVSAIDAATEPKTQLVKDKVYYTYYNTKSAKGAVAFCLDNQFVNFGDSQENISVCTKATDGTYSILHTIDKSAVGVWFAGNTNVSVDTSENIGSLLGGLSSIGITVDSTKTNVSFKLTGQEVKPGTAYYIYIPEGYFVDASGVKNVAGYINIEPEIINNYSGDLLSDLQTACDDVYDVALWGVESVLGIF